MAATTPNPAGNPMLVPDQKPAHVLAAIAAREALQVPDFLKGSKAEGIEGADAGDMLFPRLVILQPNSPLVAAAQNPDFVAGAILHTGQNRIVCKPRCDLEVHPIKFVKEYLHWGSRTSGKGIIERSTDENSDVAKKCAAQLEAQRRPGAKRIDTNQEESWNEAHTWLLYLPDLADIAAISLSKGNIRDSKQIIGVVTAKQVPARALKFKLKSAFREKPVPFKYWVMEFEWNGFASRELFTKLSESYNLLAAKSWTVEPDDGIGGDAAPGNTPDGLAGEV